MRAAPPAAGTAVEECCALGAMKPPKVRRTGIRKAAQGADQETEEEKGGLRKRAVPFQSAADGWYDAGMSRIIEIATLRQGLIGRPATRTWP